MSLMCRLRCPALQFSIWTASRAPVFGPTPTLIACWHIAHVNTHSTITVTLQTIQSRYYYINNYCYFYNTVAYITVLDTKFCYYTVRYLIQNWSYSVYGAGCHIYWFGGALLITTPFCWWIFWSQNYWSDGVLLMLMKKWSWSSLLADNNTEVVG